MKKLVSLLLFAVLAALAPAQVQNMQAASGATGDITKPTTGLGLPSGFTLNVKTGATVSGAGSYDFTSGAKLVVPNSAAPTTSAFGWLAGDNNAWASGRGALQFYDGTANTYIVAALSSDTPTDGQIPTWHTGGTITWDSPSGSPGGSNTQLQYNNSSAFGGISGATTNGTAVTYTASNLIATSPKFITGINDTNGNELFLLTATASAVNEITLANAATNNNPSLTISGGDSNIGLTIVPKGTGLLVVSTSGTNNAAAKFTIGGADKGILGTAGTAGGIITGAAADDLCFRNVVSKAIVFSTDNGSTIAGSFVASTGQFSLPKNITSTSTTTGTAVVTGGVGISENLFVGGKIVSVSGTAGLGYATGAGGAITQASSRTTGVTLNKVSGAITLVSAAGSATPASFTLTNSTIAATDVVVVSQKSGTDRYIIHVTATGAGSCEITFWTTGGTTTEQPVFNFAVIKAVAS